MIWEFMMTDNDIFVCLQYFNNETSVDARSIGFDIHDRVLLKL